MLSLTPERLDKIDNIKKQVHANTKGKPFKNISSSDKDKLLEALCLMFGLIEDIQV